ncbi:phosphoglucomutase [Granulimonas faecalis]|uniref:Phosphoglucomutase n=1 Tax=Granulimonas faecalis TaxID=2894155 RepID=A0AAV5B3H6_9ACTN|nr:phospho-sugar mutase [Granulimonas faecalis]GJM55005.1 phosphoglucomutase [Granulimonas faecalis]
MDTKIQERAQLWKENVDEPELAAELADLLAKDDDSIVDAFYRDLEFGTAGLRGVLGVGTNRMNVYTVSQATQGLADYLNAHCENPTVAIMRDSRNKGDEFVKAAAGVLAANGIKSFVAPRIEPVPVLSFTTRHLGCDAGIVITASHNPAPYNGYKVYGPDGCQIANEAADEIQASIDGTDIFAGVRSMDFGEAQEKGLVEWVGDDVIDAYLDAIQTVSVPGCVAEDGSFKVVYTPLNGSGLECVTKILSRVGIDNVVVVPEQREPNGDFPTCPYPNPEIREALQKGLELCDEVKPDLLLATDPDADRVGIAVPHDGDYKLLSGNEVGVLLVDWLARLKQEAGEDVSRKVVVSTIVSSAMPDALAGKYGFEMRRVLTGFKYIGGQIDMLTSKGEGDRYLLGFEESYGYLAGTHARDKDAVVTSMLICEMAGWYARQGKDLYEAMDGLYRELGFYLNGVVNVTFEGAAGADKMARIMKGLRAQQPLTIAGYDVEGCTDYAGCVEMPILNKDPEDPAQTLPAANVLEYRLAGGHKVIVRPSGTEPKIKAYLFTTGATREDAEAVQDKLAVAAKESLLA